MPLHFYVSLHMNQNLIRRSAAELVQKNVQERVQEFLTEIGMHVKLLSLYLILAKNIISIVILF